MSCQAIVGTPPALVTRSRSMSCIARSASHRYISTSFVPLSSDGAITAWLPVTWKNGTASSTDFWAAGSGAGSGSPRRTKLRAAANTGATAPMPMFRWVPSAPLGAPVVPEV